MQQACHNGSALHEHFDFAEPSGGEVPSLSFYHSPDTGDQKFAADDERYHPSSDAAARDSDQGDKGCGDDDLVDKRIEDAAQFGDLIEFASPPAVDEVGAGGDYKGDHGRHVKTGFNQGSNADRQYQPHHRQGVGNVEHFRTGRLSVHLQ